MSKIHEALRKLQQENRTGGTREGGTAATPEPAGPATRPAPPRKPVSAVADRLVLDKAELLRAGLLAPAEHERAVASDFRLIKRPLIDNAIKYAADYDDQMNLIMITSSVPGAGKTFCSVNLAISIANEREISVVLVDADVAKPHISDAFGLGDRPGLIDLLENDTMTVADVLVQTDLNDMLVLPAGSRHTRSTELLASDRMSHLMVEAARENPNRIFILDSPPLLLTSEAQALARQVGQVVLVVETGKTTDREIQDSLEVLDQDKAINAILNKSLYSQAGGYYGASYGSYGNDEG